MKRDNRANLWFLIIFVVLTLPGIVILFRRRLRPDAPPLMFPDAASHRLAYMTPPPAPPDASWVVPAQTRAWVDQLVRDRCGGPAVLGTDERGDPVPLLSDDRAIQAVWLDHPDHPSRVALVLWRDSTGDDPSHWVVTCRNASEVVADSLPCRLTAGTSVEIPQQIREELMARGYLRPPRRILWLDVSLPGRTKRAPGLQLTIEYVASGGRKTSSVNLFTK